MIVNITIILKYILKNKKIVKNIKMVESMLLGRITLGNTDWVDFFFFFFCFSKKGLTPIPNNPQKIQKFFFRFSIGGLPLHTEPLLSKRNSSIHFS